MTRKKISVKPEEVPGDLKAPARKGKMDEAERREPALEGISRSDLAEKGLPGDRTRPGQPDPADPHPGGPLWAPEGDDLEFVPAEVRQVIAELVGPIHERLVLDGEDPLEVSLLVTLGHLMWLEVLQQFALKQDYVRFSSIPELKEYYYHEIDQHLRIMHSKVKVGYLLAKLRHSRHDEPSTS